MRRFLLAVLLILGPAAASAQDVRESINVGVTGAVGLPPALGGVRLGAPLGPRAGIDVFVARMSRYAGEESGDGFGLVFATHVRWMRGGRASTGSSRYWIFGVLATSMRTSTLVIYPGGVRKYQIDDRPAIGPRFGYGWDQVTRAGLRYGAELTTGAIAEETPVMFVNVFLTWGPRR